MEKVKYNSNHGIMHFNEFNNILKDTFNDETAYALLYQYDGVYIGKYIKNNLNFYNINLCEDQIISIRVFNENKEIYIWKLEENFKFRKIQDGEGIECDCLEEYHMTWGTIGKRINDDWIKLSEERGIEIYFPTNKVAGNNISIYYKVKNYLKPLSDGVLTFVDARLCGFYYKDEKTHRRMVI